MRPRPLGTALRISIALCGTALSMASAAAAEESCRAAIPLDRRDPALQAGLVAALRGAGLEPGVLAGELAVSLVDLTRPGRRFYAGVNDDDMVYAASLPKIGILLALIDEVESGRIEWTDEFEYRIRRMINVSDNAQATWGAELVGLRNIARVMLDPRYCLYDTTHGGLWVGRAFRKGGESYRDPLRAISHGATSRQVARFYALLDSGGLVSQTWSARMRRLMSPPGYFHKFVRALQDRRALEFVARKSGTWQAFHADSALIQHWSNRYVLVGLAEHPDGGVWMERLARAVDDLVVAGRHRRWPRSAFRRKS